MSNIQIDINGRKYGFGCDDGQEEHLMRLARLFDFHVRNIAQNVGQIGDQKLFLMAAIMLADETHDLKLKLAATEAELARVRDSRPDANEIQKRQFEKIEQYEKDMAQLLSLACQSFDNASNRLSKIADKLEQV